MPVETPISPALRQSKYFAHKVAAIESVARMCDGNAVPPHPVEVYLELANQCNLKCVMCVTFSGINPERSQRLAAVPRQFLDYDAIAEKMDSVLANALVVHCYGFGEATLHPQFPDILAKLASYEVQIDFYTNGTKLNDAMCDLLVEKRVFEVTVSFSGTSASEYDNVYLGAQYDQVLGAIARLSETKKRHNSLWPRIRISSVAFEHHVNNLDKFVELMGDHGVETINMTPLLLDDSIPQLREHAATYTPAIHDSIIARAHERARERNMRLLIEPWLEKGEQKLSESLVQLNASPLSAMKQLARDTRQIDKPLNRHAHAAGRAEPVAVKTEALGSVLERMQFSHERRDIACLVPFSTFYVDALNHVKPCCYSNLGVGLGDVTKDNAQDIWDGPAYRALRTGALRGHYPEMCQGCLNGGLMPMKMVQSQYVWTFAHWFNSNYEPTIDPAIVKRAWAQTEEDTGQVIENLKKGRTDLLELADIESADAQVNEDARWSMLRKLVGEQKQLPEDLSLLCRGAIDGFREGTLAGWAFSPLLPHFAIPIDIYFDGKLVHQTQANRWREDLANQGMGHGACCFAIPLTALPSLENVKTITACVGTTQCELIGSPMDVHRELALI